MSRLLVALLGISITLAVPAVLTVNGIRLVVNDSYVKAVYDHGGIPTDRYGFSSADRQRLALVGLHSIEPSSKEGVNLLRGARLRDGEPAFNTRELTHMQDVRNLLASAYRFDLVVLVVIAALALALGLRSGTRTVVPVALGRGALLTVAVAVAVAVVAATSFGWFSTPFHRTFFDGDSWRFAETDTLRRLYPDRFWLDTAIVVGVLAVLQAAIVFPLARFWARHAGAPRALRLRARTEST
jgi:integral membrane protein (TIGR01906 family)